MFGCQRVVSEEALLSARIDGELQQERRRRSRQALIGCFCLEEATLARTMDLFAPLWGDGWFDPLIHPISAHPPSKLMKMMMYDELALLMIIVDMQWCKTRRRACWESRQLAYEWLLIAKQLSLPRDVACLIARMVLRNGKQESFLSETLDFLRDFYNSRGAFTNLLIVWVNGSNVPRREFLDEFPNAAEQDESRAYFCDLLDNIPIRTNFYAHLDTENPTQITWHKCRHVSLESQKLREEFAKIMFGFFASD